jgi:hypothetical protein
MAKANASKVVTRKPATKRVPTTKRNATTERLKQLYSVALTLVNANNAQDTASDALSAARKSFFAECKQSFGASFYKADKSVVNQPRVIFYMAHYESKGLAANVSVDSLRGTLKMEAIDASQTDAIKKEAANAGTRFNKFLKWCADEAAGKHAEKDPNNRQSESGTKRTPAEIVKDAGQRIFNAYYKAGKRDACVELQAWATKHAKGVKFAVPAGSK